MTPSDGKEEPDVPNKDAGCDAAKETVQVTISGTRRTTTRHSLTCGRYRES
jgi:hypothetical protein